MLWLRGYVDTPSQIRNMHDPKVRFTLDQYRTGGLCLIRSLRIHKGEAAILWNLESY